jgi:hypothetical protein
MHVSGTHASWTPSLALDGPHIACGPALGLYGEVTTAILARLPGIAWVGLGSAEVKVGTKHKRPPVWRALREHFKVVTFL